MLQTKGLSKIFGQFQLRDITFDVPQGAYFVLLGQSGAGKTLILEMLAGLIKPDSGTVRLNAEDVTLCPVQGRRMGLVYQDCALFPHLTVARNIGYALKRGAHRSEQIRSLASRVGARHLLDRNCQTLSLGESQRVALARTLAMNPNVLLLDEPLASLDRISKTKMRAMLRDLHRQGQTVVHVTHDYEEALALATHVAVLEHGTITQCGNPDTIFHKPKSEFVAHFVGIRNYFHGKYTGGDQGCGTFQCPGLDVQVASDLQDGPVCLIVSSDEVTVSLERHASSARNCLRAVLVDMEPVQKGVELTLNAGVTLYALVTHASVRHMVLAPGKQVWASFKATGGRLIEAGGESFD